MAFFALMAVALVLRLTAISNHTDVSDEGIRGLQLRLMAAGFRPVSEIYASQGPLSLTALYPLYVAFGGDIVAARLAVVVYSLVGLLAVYWLGRLVGGRVGGWAAAGLLLLSPTYLVNSRLALVEVPALVPATLALGAGLAYGLDGRRRWLLASAVALALALSIKPMTVPVVPAIGLALLLRRVPSSELKVPSGRLGRRARLATLSSELGADVALYAAVAIGVAGAIVLAVGPAELYDQLVRY